jgi:hypothetical protein
VDETTDEASSPRRVGPYRLTRSLGKGGFGEVFLGEGEDGTRAAVKILHATWAGDAEMRRRFAAEVEQARRVSGFCIATILDAEPEADEPWIATEYIDGPTLQHAVAEDGPRAGAELQRLAVSTATALAAIHAAGVVHRDLKPDNIMLAQDGPRVIDFGIARAVESTSVTASGIVGTVGYMAPEQLEGMRLTAAVDVFAWASVMVFAATGREAFHGPTQASRIARVLSGEPDTGDLSGPLLETVLACLEKDPKRRPDAAALLHHLVAGTAARPVETADPDPGPSVAPTRVEGAPAPPTRQYTEIGVPDPGVVPDPSAATAQPRAAHTADPASESGVPPYRFAGTRFTRIEDLAAAMQRNWSQALQVFGDPGELGALGSWVMDDLRDTKVDRSLFRRRVRDVNLALTTFVAEAAPALPPRFRDHDASIGGLTKLFGDPRPLVTGAPESNELLLLARPEVLSRLARHEGPDSARLGSLARDVERAEQAGLAFHRELTENLNGWRGTQPRVAPALALVFLLNPESAIIPNPTGGAEVREWLQILWSRVEQGSGADRAGTAAAVYGSVGTVVNLVEQRRSWWHDYESCQVELAALSKDDLGQKRMNLALVLLPVLALPSCVLGGGLAASQVPGVGMFLVSLSVLAIVAFSILLILRPAGNSPFHTANRARLNELPSLMHRTAQGLQAMDHDLVRARQICSRPPQKRF